MRFLADMGVSIRVVEWLADLGHDAVHLREECLHTVPDDEIFAKAVNEDRVIITFDLDFGEIAARCRDKRTSVIVFRLHNTRVSHVIERLSHVLAVSAKPLDSGVVITVEESRHRIRYFVMGETHD